MWNGLFHLKSIHPLWKIYRKPSTGGVWIPSGLAHQTLPREIFYTLCGRLNQNVYLEINMAYLTIEGAIYSHFYTKIEFWSIKLGWGVKHSFTWMFSMEIQIPESKFTPLTMINVIIFKIFTTFHCKRYFLMDRVWPSKCNIST